MSAVPIRRRSTRAEANDVLLRRALVRLVAESGWDAVSVSGVAREAGLSTTVVYSRAETISEFGNDVWSHVLSPELDGAVDALIATIGAADHDAAEAELRRWASPAPELSAAVQLMTAALFDDELDEVVGEHCRRTLHAVCFDVPPNVGAIRATVLGIAFALALGMRGNHQTDSPVGYYTPLVADFDENGASLGRVSLPPVPVVTWTKPIHDTDPYLSAVIPATVEVLAERGFRRSTVARISRRSGISAGAIFSRFPDKAHLVAAAARRTVLNATEMDAPLRRLRRKHGNVLAQAIWMRELVRPQNRALWSLRLDLARAARHEPVLAEFSTETHKGPYFGVMLLASFVDGLHELPYEAAFPTVVGDRRD